MPPCYIVMALRQLLLQRVQLPVVYRPSRHHRLAFLLLHPLLFRLFRQVFYLVFIFFFVGVPFGRLVPLEFH